MDTKDFGSTSFPLPADHYLLESLAEQPITVNYQIEVKPFPVENVLPHAQARYAYAILSNLGYPVVLYDRNGSAMIANYENDEYPIRYPQPGQAVKIGDAIGIINGEVGHPADTYRVVVGKETFFGPPQKGATAPILVQTRGEGDVYQIETSRLSPTNETVLVETWHWLDRPKYEGQETAFIDMPLWIYNPS